MSSLLSGRSNALSTGPCPVGFMLASVYSYPRSMRANGLSSRYSSSGRTHLSPRTFWEKATSGSPGTLKRRLGSTLAGSRSGRARRYASIAYL